MCFRHLPIVMKGLKIICLFISLLLGSSRAFSQTIIENKEVGYTFLRPSSLQPMPDSLRDSLSDFTYFDEVNGIVFIISVRDSIFSKSSTYMDCAKADLQNQLRLLQGDSTLTLVSCSRSKYYPEKAIVLHFETKLMPADMNRCVIYFVHHRKKEIQFSFMYDKSQASTGLAYIDSIMRTLVLLN